MSYSMLLFNPAMQVLAANGKEFDAIELPPIAPEAIATFLARLEKYGYTPSDETEYGPTFTREADGSEIEVLVASTEISFSVRGASTDAVFEALQDASELADCDDLALFNPQEGRWLET